MKSLFGRFRFLLVFGTGLLTLAFPPSFSKAQDRAPVQVMTSIFPLREFAKAVGGERAEVQQLLPPGAEAHAWEPKPSAVAKISKADIFVFIGPSMEPWANKVLKAVQGKNLIVVEAGRDLPLVEAEPEEGGEEAPSHRHGHKEKMDPHIWLDFSMDLKIVDAILAAFVKKDPKQAGDYKKYAEGYKGRLLELDKKYQETLASCRHRQIIMGGHAAFGYLARRYGLRHFALSGVSPNAEPTPKKMTGIVDQIKKTGAKYIFAEELVHPKMSQALAKEAGVRILILNPGGNLTADQSKQKLTFLDLMERNLKSLQQGLECASP